MLIQIATGSVVHVKHTDIGTSFSLVITTLAKGACDVCAGYNKYTTP